MGIYSALGGYRQLTCTYKTIIKHEKQNSTSAMTAVFLYVLTSVMNRHRYVLKLKHVIF